MPRKFVISPTKLKTFYQCPAKYRLEYIDKLGRFYHRARAGFSFGNTLHRVMDAFHNAGSATAVTPEQLGTALDQLWVTKGYSSPEEEEAFKAEAARILTEYHATAVAAEQAAAAPDATPPPHLLFTEKTLRHDLTPDVALSGRVDRVDEHHDGALEIVDYKSGREVVEVEDVAESLALSVYQYLLKKKYPDRRVFATLVALRTGASASYEMPAEEHVTWEADWQETGEILRTKDWETVLPVVNSHCPHCDFLPHCARFWRMQARREGVPPPDIALGV